MNQSSILRRKEFSILGILIYIISLITGYFGYATISLIGFTVSYMLIFLNCIHLQISQFDKGMCMILAGSMFVAILSAAIGIDSNDSKIINIPTYLKMTYPALIAISGATFLGAGGSLIANEASEHSSNLNNDKSFLSIENKLKRIYRLLWGIAILAITTFIGVIALGILHIVQ